MKIVVWNLENLGNSKLDVALNSVLNADGLGGTVLDYIIKVVMGDPVWSGMISATLPDVFVIIELTSGGDKKGDPASGKGLIGLGRLLAAMNGEAQRRAQAGTPTYEYDFVPPLVVGRHESVGIIYNKEKLTLGLSGVLRNNAKGGVHYLPRDPFWAAFTLANGLVIDVVGVHAPKTGTTPPNRFKDPITYANSLTGADRIEDRTGVSGSFVMGDFNCDPSDTYGELEIEFSMDGYITSLATRTLSSVRNTLVHTPPQQPSDYLSAAYDNLLYAFDPGSAPARVVERVPDLIAGAKAFAGRPVMVFNNYDLVSNHLPVIFEY